MTTISLPSVETCIMTAYQHWLSRTPGNYIIATTDGNVGITVVINGSLWNCGFPGFNMAEGDINGLRTWCQTNPGGGLSFGFRGHDANHPDSVNVILMGENEMFNFHVYTV